MCPHCVVEFLLTLPFVAAAVNFLYRWYRQRKAACSHENCEHRTSSPLDLM